MSHTEAKQFYQRHQLETQYGGSQAGEAYSPAMRAKTFPANFGTTDNVDFQGKAESIRSRKSNVTLATGPTYLSACNTQSSHRIHVDT